ncbi:hypothetical protein DFH09DRAFT_861747, partial [Mycena vulgaris]
QMAAEESLLQMIPLPVLLKLMRFCQDPTENNVKQLLEIPAVYNVLRHEKSSAGEYSGNTMKTCNWLIARTTYVVSYLIDKGRKLETPGSMIQEQWQKVC